MEFALRRQKSFSCMRRDPGGSSPTRQISVSVSADVREREKERDRLLAPNFLRLFIGSQPQKHRLPNLAVERPLGELDLGDKDRLDPGTSLHDRWSYPLAPAAAPFLRKIHKRATRASDLL